ncbi:hypothetical protein Tco_1082350 [Tanacetum coccineum]|uniref:Uncharacterized protein n=1 Tax=Tanacetum coccineum TaxID=301880 RepID=A0ABQ5I084_9ASTR
MSSPTIPTSNIGGCFFSNFLTISWLPRTMSQLHQEKLILALQITHLELLPLKKRVRDRSSSSTSTLPQAFEIGESSRKKSLERHEEQIEEILNHLDELSLDRIEHSRTQIAKLQRKQMGNNSKIALARFRIANLEQIIEEIQVRHQADKESLLNAIYEHKNSQEGPSNY